MCSFNTGIPTSIVGIFVQQLWLVDFNQPTRTGITIHFDYIHRGYIRYRAMGQNP